jgi:hypothetical protein
MACGGDGNTSEPEPAISDSVLAFVDGQDAWSHWKIVPDYDVIVNGAQVPTLGYGLFLLPRGARAELKIPAIESEHGAMYGPATVVLAMPDTIHATGAGVGEYHFSFSLPPKAMGAVRAEWQGRDAVPTWTLEFRHPSGLGPVQADSLSYGVAQDMGMGGGSVPVSAFVGDPSWVRSWAPADVQGIARFDLPAEGWSTTTWGVLSLTAIVHDQSMRYRVSCTTPYERGGGGPLECLMHASPL